MRLRTLSLLCLAVLALPSVAQTAAKPVYVESFRKGSTGITEQTLQVNLTKQSPRYEARVKDSSGHDHFQLTFSPVRIGAEDPSILAWQVSLVDVRRRLYGNLLFPYRDPALNTGPTGHISTLDPNPYAIVPTLAKRVIKVENFYCSIEVKKYHLPVPGVWHLDSMDVEVELTNRSPLDN